MRTLFTAGASTNVTNTATETTCVSTVGKGSPVLPHSFFTIGRGIRITASGTYDTELVPVTLNVRIRFGGVAGTVILATGDQTPAGSVVDGYWYLTTDIICRTAGATGTVIGQSSWTHQAVALAASLDWAMLGTATTVDLTTAIDVVLSADWGVGADTDDDFVTDTLVIEAI